MFESYTILTYFFFTLCGISFLIEVALLIYIYYLHQKYDKQINDILTVLEKVVKKIRRQKKNGDKNYLDKCK